MSKEEESLEPKKFTQYEIFTEDIQDGYNKSENKYIWGGQSIRKSTTELISDDLGGSITRVLILPGTDSRLVINGLKKIILSLEQDITLQKIKKEGGKK